MEPTMEDMKFFGSLTILSQSFKTIFKWKNIFAQITLHYILPLAIVFIFHMHSHRLFHGIEDNPYQLFTGAFRSYRSYYDVTGATSTDWLNYFFFKSAFIVCVTSFSLLSTATVVYTTACVYTGRDVTFRESIEAVSSKVWKRLGVTLLSMLLNLFSYSLITSVVIFITTAVIDPSFELIQFFTLSAICIIYIFRFLYITMTWQIASVVSVLESSYGLKSMIKATDLMQGKRKTAFNVSILMYLVFAVTVYLYMSLIAYNKAELAVAWRLMIGIVCVIVLVITFLLVMVTETVLYLVCK